MQGQSCLQECESGIDFQTPGHIFLYQFSAIWYQPATNLAAVTVCSVGIGTTVDGATGVGCIFSVSAACQ